MNKQKQRFKYLYERLNGFIMEESDGIPDLFADGSECGTLYGKAYDARVRLSLLIDGTADGENTDTMIIVRAYEKIAEVLSERLYKYGYEDGKAVKESQ